MFQLGMVESLVHGMIFGEDWLVLVVVGMVRLVVRLVFSMHRNIVMSLSLMANDWFGLMVDRWASVVESDWLLMMDGSVVHHRLMVYLGSRVSGSTADRSVVYRTMADITVGQHMLMKDGSLLFLLMIDESVAYRLMIEGSLVYWIMIDGSMVNRLMIDWLVVS